MQTFARVSGTPRTHTLRTAGLDGSRPSFPLLPKSYLPLRGRVPLPHATFPPTCAPRIHSSHLLVFLLILAAAFWLVQLLRSVCNLFSFWDIQVFYREALHIPPVSWARVEGCRVRGQRTGEEWGLYRRKGSPGKQAEGLTDTYPGPPSMLEVGYHHL